MSVLQARVTRKRLARRLPQDSEKVDRDVNTRSRGGHAPRLTTNWGWIVAQNPGMCPMKTSRLEAFERRHGTFWRRREASKLSPVCDENGEIIVHEDKPVVQTTPRVSRKVSDTTEAAKVAAAALRNVKGIQINSDGSHSLVS